MKKILLFFLPLLLLLIPKDTFAQSISPTNFLIKNSNNTSVLYQSSSRDYFTSTPYYSGKFEMNLGSTSVEYNASYGLDMYLTLYVGAFSDYGNFGYGNPELYVNSNGLHLTGYTISSFTNTKGACSNVVCPYQLHLSFTFSTQYQGTIYIALPYDIPYDTYGWTLNTMDLTNYGSNTSNSDIIANNNQNTQNIISNNNNNTQQIINSQNTISNQIIDDTAPNSEEINTFLEEINMVSFGPISGILQIPIRVIGSFRENFNESCRSVTLGRLYGHDITMTCIDIKSILGNDLYTMMDILIAFFCFYELFMYMIHIYDRFTSLTDDFNDLYRKGAIH